MTGRSLVGAGVLLFTLNSALATAELANTALFSRFYGTVGISLSAFDDAEGVVGVIERTSKTNNLSASIGRYFGKNNRIGLAATRSRSSHLTSYASPFTPSNQRFDHESLHYSLSVYRTFLRRSRLSLFAGGGVGLNRTRQKQVITYPQGGLSFESSHRHQRLSLNASLNLSYRLSGRLAVRAGYRVNRTKGGDVNQTQSTFNLSLSISVASQTP